MIPINRFLSYISGKTETEQQITLQITGKPEAEHDDTPEGVSPLSSPLSQARSRYDHHQHRFHYHHLHRWHSPLLSLHLSQTRWQCDFLSQCQQQQKERWGKDAIHNKWWVHCRLPLEIVLHFVEPLNLCSKWQSARRQTKLRKRCLYHSFMSFVFPWLSINKQFSFFQIDYQKITENW